MNSSKDDLTRPVDTGSTIDPMIGMVLDNRYRIEVKLGSGGMGAVYLAKNLQINKAVAVKVLHPQLMIDERISARFDQEINVMSSLSHPNLVTIQDAGYTEYKTPYFVMEYIECKSLDEIIKDGTEFGEEEILDILYQTADALSHAHSKGIVHRDLKPANILLVVSPGQYFVKVVDLGIAKALITQNDSLENQLTRTGEVFGSPQYMSPEQCNGQPQDERTDVYAIGCLIYAMVLGRPPFVKGTVIQTVVSQVNDEPPPFSDFIDMQLASPLLSSLEAIARKCLEKAPSDRYQNMIELQRDLKVLKSQNNKIPDQDLLPAPGSRGNAGAQIDTFGKEAIARASQNAALNADPKAARGVVAKTDPTTASETDPQNHSKSGQSNSITFQADKKVVGLVGGLFLISLIGFSIFGVSTMLTQNRVPPPVTPTPSSSVPLSPNPYNDADPLKAALNNMNHPVLRVAFEPHAGDSSSVKVLSVYHGKPTGDFTEIINGAIDVDLKATTEPITLVLNAYMPTTWRLHRTGPDVKVKQVITVGFYPQTVEGLPPGTEFSEIYSPYLNKDSSKSTIRTHQNAFDPWMFLYLSGDNTQDESDFKRMKEDLYKFTGDHIRGFEGTRATDRFVVN